MHLPSSRSTAGPGLALPARVSVAVRLALFALCTMAARAQVLYWDINGATAGGSNTTSASGTWNTTTANWSTSAAGTAATTTWTDGATAVFSAGTNVTGVGSFTNPLPPFDTTFFLTGITLSTGRTVSGLRFEEGEVRFSGAGQLTLGSAQTEIYAAAGAIGGISTSLLGSGQLVKTGDGTFSFAGGSYTGGTAVNGGTLLLASSLANATDSLLGTGALSFNGGTLSVPLNGTFSFNKAISLGASGGGLTTPNLTPGAGLAINLNGIISGVGGLTVSGNATYRLQTNATYTGSTTINSGAILELSNDHALASSGVQVNAGGLLNLRDSVLVFSTPISGAGGLTVLAGNGTLTLSGNNTFSGGAVIGHDVAAANDQALGTGTITLTTGSLAASGGNRTLTNPVVVSGGVLTTTGALPLTLAGPVTVAGNTAVTGSGTLTIAGAIGGAANLTVTTGVIFSGNNTYTGSTTVSSPGTLTLGHDRGLGAVTNTLTLSGGALDLGGVSATQGSLILGNASTVRNGSLTVTGDLTADSAATLTLGNVTFTATGNVTQVPASVTIAPGITTLNAPGLTVFGNITLASGATLRAGATDVFYFAIRPLTLTEGATVALNGFDQKVHGLSSPGTSWSGGASSDGQPYVLNQDNQSTPLGTLLLDSAVLTIGLNGDPSSTTTTYLGTITGNGSLVKNGPGSLFLGAQSVWSDGATIVSSTPGVYSVPSSFTGGTTLNGGMIFVGNNLSLGTGPVTVTSGGLQESGTSAFSYTLANPFRLNGNFSLGRNLTLTGPVTLLSDSTLSSVNVSLEHSGGGPATIAGEISGPYRLTIGAGDFASPILLSGVNTYSGGTLLTGGTVLLGSAQSLGSGSITATSGNLQTSGNATAVTLTNPFSLNGSLSLGRNLTLSGPVTLLSDSVLSSANLTAGGTGAATVTGQISGPYRLTIAAGGNASTLLFSSANTYSGGTLMTGGTLQLGHGQALGNATAPLTLSGGTLDLNGFTPTVGAFTMSGGTLTGGVPSASSYVWQGGDVAASLSGAIVVSKTGAGTLTLERANTHTGATTVSAGTLQLNDSLAVQNSTLALTGGTTTLGSPTAYTFGGLAGTQPLVLGNTSGSAVALTVGSNNSDTSYSGVLSGAGSSLTKVGNGTLTLTGASTYHGGTTLSAGVLDLSAATTAVGSGALTMAGGALRFSTGGTFANPLLFTSDSASLDVSTGQTVVLPATLPGNLTLTKLGNGTLNLTAATSSVSGFVLDHGTLQLSGNVTTTARLNLGALAGSTGTLAVSGSGAYLNSASDLDLGLAGAGNLTISAGGRVDSLYGLIALTGDVASNVLVTGTGSQWNNQGGVVVGSVGTGTLQILAGGVVTASEGHVGGGAGSVSTAIVSGAGSRWAASSYFNLGAAGTGTLTLADSGVLKIGASGDGPLNVGLSGAASGTLNIGAPVGSAPAVPGILQAANITGYSGSGAKLLNFNHTDSAYTFAVPIAGSLAVRQTAGTTFLTGNNTYTGGTTLAGGTLSVASDAFLGDATGALTLAGGTLQLTGDFTTTRPATLSGPVTLEIAAGKSATFSTGLSGAGSLTKTGSGGLTLSAANAYTGSTTISAGTLTLGASSALAGSLLTYDAAGGTLGFGSLTSATLGGLQGNRSLALDNASSAGVALNIGSNNLDTTYAGILSGNGSLTKAGSGVLSLSGNQTYTGGTTLGGGTLSLSGRLARVDGAVTAPLRTAGATGLIGLQASASTTLQLSSGSVIAGGNGGNGGDNSSSGLLSGAGGAGAGAVSFGDSATLSNAGALTGGNAGAAGLSIVLGISPQTARGGAGGVAATAVLMGNNAQGSSSGSITGGNGGAGGQTTAANGSSDANAMRPGAGGAGGAGLAFGTSSTFTNSGTISGGAGGAGGASNASVLATSGAGGAGGAGVIVGSGSTFTNTGTISGGAGGARNSAVTSAQGAGGAAITATSATIINSGTLTGALSGDGVTRANAITLTGTTNSLELRAGSTITGNVSAGGTTDTLILGGTTDATFSSQIGTGLAYTGFESFQKTGTSQWILTGNSTFTGTVTLSAGTLQFGNGGNSGWLTSGNITDNAALSFNRIDVITVGQVISGSGTVAQNGGGSVTFSNANTYTGGTSLNAGTTYATNASGSAFGTGPVTVAAGAKLSGPGSFTGAFTNNGIYAPGNSPALVNLTSFNQGFTGILQMELAGLTRGTQYDALNISGTANFGGTLSVSLLGGFTPVAGNSFDLLNYTTATGSFATLDLPALSSGLAWNTSSLYSDGIISVVSAIPEPGTYAALAGLLALGFAARRRWRGRAVGRSA